MITQNIFTGGLNQDIAKTKMSKDQYLDALNMRILTDAGSSSGTLQNVRGNFLSFTLPNTYNVYKVSVNQSGPYVAGTITIGGQTSSGTFTPSASSTGQDLYDFIDTDVNLTQFNISYKIAVEEDYIIVFSQTINTSPSFAGTGLTVTTTQSGESNLIPIGFTTIRDDIYIFSAKAVTKNPGGHDSTLPTDTSSSGQIWKLVYDEITYASTIELIYNGLLDFTAYRPIPVTAALGRYENEDTQRIYWTDFFNPLRSVNVADPNLMAINVEYINIQPPSQNTIPLLKSISSGGNLEIGVYQLCYRYKNVGGALTNYSELSNMVFITQGTENSNDFKEYIGNNIGVYVSKTINWILQDLDTNYDTIELVVVKRNTLSGILDIFLIGEEPIPSDGELEVSYSGTEDITNIDETEFLRLAGSFTHCKSIREKDNRLFALNIKNQYSDIDYDARAYRYNTGGPPTFAIIDGGNTTTGLDATDYTNIDETNDAINPSNLATTDPSYLAGYLYDTAGNLGGEGPNISYTFGQIAVKSDSILLVSNPSTDAEYRRPNPEFGASELWLDVNRIDDTNTQLYYKGNAFSDIKNAYYSGLLKGYQPSEMYRFGIQFFDKRKRPLFTKWIGDILFPNIGDSLPAANCIYEDQTLSASTVVEPSFIANKSGSNEGFVNQLYIKFEVNIPATITNIVSGYSIVRVERTEDNKSVLGTGMLNQVYSDGGTLWLPDLQIVDGGAGCGAPDGPYTNMNIEAANHIAPLQTIRYTFDCPEFLLGSYPGWQSGDQIRVAAKYWSNSLAGGDTQVGGAGDAYRIRKIYDADALYNVTTGANQYSITQAGECALAGQYAFSGGFTYNNYTRTEATTSDSIGAKTLCVELGTSLSYSGTYGCLEAVDKKLIAFYYRPLTNQYGGNTYSSRSRNEYINCSHFRPINESLATLADDFKCFGGDVFSQIYDNQKAIKNWGFNGRTSYSAGASCAPNGKDSITFYFPCYATHNTDLRHGDHVNRTLLTDDGNGASGTETLNYNTVYSCENNIKKYFPKPLNFLLNEEFDNRIYYSEIKINGEESDSFGSFLANNFYDVDGSFGPINGAEIYNDNMIFFQERAVGVLGINPVSTTIDDSGTAVILGKGDVIQDHKYYTNTSGTRHQHSIIKSANGLYWIDSVNKRMYKLTGQGIGSTSELKGLSSWFVKALRGNVVTTDNPIYVDSTSRAGILGAVLSRYNEIIYTIHDYYSYMDGGDRVDVVNSYTIAYNELTNSYTSFYSFKPYMYIWDQRLMYSFDPSRYTSTTPTLQQRCYTHDINSNYGKFYGTYYDSYIKIVVNDKPNLHKIFDNLHLQTEVQEVNEDVIIDTGSGLTPIHETFNKVRVYNDYQDTGTITLTSGDNITRRHRYWKTYIPRDTTNAAYSSFAPRIRDFYAIIQLSFTNNTNVNGYPKRLICHDILTEYRAAGTPITTQ